MDAKQKLNRVNRLGCRQVAGLLGGRPDSWAVLLTGLVVLWLAAFYEDDIRR
jgi:hypothetical protein